MTARHSAGTAATHFPNTAQKSRNVAAAFSQATRCSSVEQVQAVVGQVLRRTPHCTVRCGGNLAASSSAAFDSSTHVRLILDGELTAVTLLQTKDNGAKVFHVGAGCLIGHDPTNPISRPETTLMAQLMAAGCALPLVGGSSNMTLGGFFMTGSEGGSIQHALSQCILSFDLVDGRGMFHTLHKGSDAFNAIGVSMGLFGVITGFTLELLPAYRLQGTEQTQRRKDSILNDSATFLAAHSAHDNVHAYWFPNRGVDSVQSYVADRVNAVQARRPYAHELQGALKNQGYRVVMRAVNWAIHRGHSRTAASLLQLFAKPKKMAKHFCDDWNVAGPNDDQVGIATRRGFESTEIWFDIAYADQVLAACRALFERDPIACGHSGLQIFCAARSPFWMSPAFGADQIRVDTLWWPDCQEGSAGDYFARFWDALLNIPTARLHWGKELPPIGQAFGPDFLTRAYPRMGEWLAMRQAFDPEQIFVSNFWREIFNIKKDKPC